MVHSCLTAKIDGESPRCEIQQQNTSENVTKVSVINEDFEYAIFENSNLKELLKFAQNPRVSGYVIKHPVKYHNYDIFINANTADNFQHGFEVMYDRGLSLNGYNFYMDVIKYFGASIQKLNIYNTHLISDEQSATLHRYVNEYCADSLTQLYLESSKENTLTQFQKPFSKLTDLFICIG